MAFGRVRLHLPFALPPQDEGYAMRSIAGSSRSTESGEKKRRLPTVFFACPQHDKPATYCSCKREEGEDEDQA